MLQAAVHQEIYLKQTGRGEYVEGHQVADDWMRQNHTGFICSVPVGSMSARDSIFSGGFL